MAAIVCEECGGQLQLDALGRVAICMTCGAQASRERLQKQHMEQFQPLCAIESEIRNLRADYFAMEDALSRKPRRLRFAVPMMLVGMFMGMGMGAMTAGETGEMMTAGVIFGLLFFVVGLLIGLIIDGGKARRLARIRTKSKTYAVKLEQLEKKRDAIYANLSLLG
jgi:hypothetical protein